MKVRAKETSRMTYSDEIWIIKGKEYELQDDEGDYIFKSEVDPEHGLSKSQLDEFFEIISDKPRICEILDVEVNELFELRTSGQNIPLESKYYITEDGRFMSENNYKSPTLGLETINGKLKIVKLPKYTDEQKEIFKALKTLGFEYILCDKFQNLWATTTKKEDDNINIWNKEVANNMGLNNFKDIFDFIKYEDEEPFEIPEVMR